MEEMQRLFVALIAAWLCFGVLDTVFGPEDESLGVLSGLCAAACVLQGLRALIP